MKQKGDYKGETYYLDTETTGLKKAEGATLLELVLLRSDGHVAMHTLIDPGMPIPEAITKINGITDDMVRGQPTLPVALKRLGSILKPGDLVCIYNADFDKQWVGDAIQIAGASVHCTMLDYAYFRNEYDVQKQRMKWHKLGVAAEQVGYTLPSGFTAHRALADCYMTRAVQEHIWDSHIKARGNGGLMVAVSQYENVMDIVRERMANDRATEAALYKAISGTVLQVDGYDRESNGGRLPLVDGYWQGHREALDLVCKLLNEPTDLEMAAMKRHQERKQKPRRDEQEQGR